MKFGTFVFPVVPDPTKDGQGIQDALEEARVSEELGMDAVWVAEHHFDGNCVYVDPISFAAALCTLTKRVEIGSAVIQASLHHPIRLAEQISILDNMSKGRFIAGLGKGSQFNTYEYEAFEVPPGEATERFDETEEILLKSWAGSRSSITASIGTSSSPCAARCPGPSRTRATCARFRARSRRSSRRRRAGPS